jgi:hypothetical protein
MVPARDGNVHAALYSLQQQHPFIMVKGGAIAGAVRPADEQYSVVKLIGAFFCEPPRLRSILARIVGQSAVLRFTAFISEPRRKLRAPSAGSPPTPSG